VVHQTNSVNAQKIYLLGLVTVFQPISQDLCKFRKTVRVV